MPASSDELDISTELPVDVSIVLPVHNEAGHLQAEIDRIAEAMDASTTYGS